MEKYVVNIHWSDDEYTGTDEFPTIAGVREFISKELWSCAEHIQDYPEGVYPNKILITRVEED